MSTFKAGTYIHVADERGVPYKFFKNGSNHRLEVTKGLDGKLSATVIPVSSAARMARTFEGANPPAAILVLHNNDMVTVEEGGIRRCMRVQNMSCVEGRVDIVLRDHHAADPEDAREQIRIRSVSKLASIRRIEVDPLGRVTDRG